MQQLLGPTDPTASPQSNKDEATLVHTPSNGKHFPNDAFIIGHKIQNSFPFWCLK
jgi:hypothetical protein